MINEDLFNLAGNQDIIASTPSLLESLQDRDRATRKIIAAFISLGPKASSPDCDDLRRQCSRLQTQVRTLETHFIVTPFDLSFI